jgi:hypothetical protein
MLTLKVDKRTRQDIRFSQLANPQRIVLYPVSMSSDAEDYSNEDGKNDVVPVMVRHSCNGCVWL